MADIYFNCACGKSLAVDEKGVGTTVKCVDCGRPVKVPEVEIEFACEGCNATLLASMTACGHRIMCTICGQRMSVPEMVINHNQAESPAVSSSAGLRADTLGQALSEFQARRRSLPEPAPAGIAWRQSVSLKFRLAILVLVLAIGAGLVQWFISSHRVEMYGQKHPSILPKEVSVRKASIQNAEEKPSVRQTVQTPLAIQTAILTKKADKAMPVYVATPSLAETSQGLPGVSAREPGRIGDTISAVASLERSPSAQPKPEGTSADMLTVKSAVSPVQSLLEKYRELQTFWKKNRRDRKDPASVAKIRHYWEDVLAYTRSHSGGDLTDVCWAIPFRTAYEQMLNHVCRDRAQAETLTREAITVLRESQPESPALAARLGGDVALIYAYMWMKSDVIGCARMVDEMAAWVDATEDKPAKQAFFAQGMFFDGNCLLNQFQVPEAEREAFCAKREQHLNQCLADKDLRLGHRTLAVSHWAECLLRLGRNGEADRQLRAWRQRHSDKIVEAMYFQVFLEDALSVQGDWAQARTILDKATALSGRWDRTYEAKVYETICEIYYDNIQFPDYELKRAGSVAQRKNEQKIRSMSSLMAAGR